MSVRVLFAARPAQWESYEGPLIKAIGDTGVAAEISPDVSPPETVDYIVYSPASRVQDFTPYVQCKAVLNLWAGVEGIVGNTTLTQPLARMVDPGMTEGMVEWVTGHVLRHHLGMDVHIHGQDGVWREGVVPPLARDRPVTVLGLGALGTACAKALAGLNFDVTGWSRSQKDVPGIRCLSGPKGLEEALTGAEIVVLLVPLTAETEGVLESTAIARMAPGSVVINPGRGPLIDDTALLAALDSGHLSHATLDVFRVEPLPANDPFWAHAKVTVTPHIASETRIASASRVIAENIRRGEAGEPFLNLVDRSRGY